MRAVGGLPEKVADEIANNALARVEALLSAIITEVLSNLHRFVLEFLMMALYITFWLSDPMPVGSSIQELFKRYIILKSAACLGYGLCVGILFWLLHIDLAAPFGLAAFLLSYMPEVGPFMSMLLPVPVILFDGRLKSPALTFLIATGAQLALKFIFANIVEVKLVEADRLMKMHPVIILLAVSFFGYIWGPTGMLLSVPLVAYFKVALLSDAVPARYRDPALIVLEGDRQAPTRHKLSKRGVLHRRDGESPLSSSTAAGLASEDASVASAQDHLRIAAAAREETVVASAAEPIRMRSASSPSSPRGESGRGVGLAGLS